MHLLHVVGSPRAGSSASRDVASNFVNKWSGRHLASTIDLLDVWQTEIPPFDGPALAAKYAGLSGTKLTDEQTQVWTEIRSLAARFLKADLILVSVPMWNFGVPYRLKHLIDAVSQKDLLFAFDGQRLNGLLVGKKMVIVAARGARLGGDYPEQDFDHQIAYLRTWARMVGISHIDAIAIEGTLSGPEADKAARVAARAQADKLAAAI